MIPTTANGIFFERNAETVIYPSLTYGLRLDENEIYGDLTDIGALKLTIAKILLTERYESLIYSWNYGVELQDLFGKSFTDVKDVLPERVRDALLQDDRINGVTDFKATQTDKGSVAMTFTVNSIFGAFKDEAEVIL